MEQVPDGFLSVLLSKSFCGNECQCFFRAPFNALWFVIFIVGAAVAGEHNFLFRMHVHSAELTRGDAPSATVAC